MIRRATSHPDPLPDLPPSPRPGRRKGDEPAVHAALGRYHAALCGVVADRSTANSDYVTCGNCRRILARRRRLVERERRP